MSAHGIADIFERNQEATLYVGNIDQKIDEEILWEFFVQCGPLASVNMPKDKITQMHMGYSFVEFKNEDDADYAIKVMNMVKLFGKPLRCTKASSDRKTTDVGANLFVGNLDKMVDDKALYDCFSSFGVLLVAKIMRDPDSLDSRGFGFISYDSFEAADAALAGMNSQFLCNQPISVSYAYTKDTKGERHGDASERLLAELIPKKKGKGKGKGAPPRRGGGLGPPTSDGRGFGGPPPFKGKGKGKGFGKKGGKPY